MKRRKFVSWLGLAPFVAAMPVNSEVSRIACIKWSDGEVTKRVFFGLDIGEAQSKAVAWLVPILALRKFEEVMITNPDDHHIWPGEVR